MRSPRVVKPLIGISCCTKQFGVFGMPNHAASDTYVKATDEVIGGVPVLLPANGPMADIETLLDRLDGIILTGSRSNVQPALYDGPPHAEGTWEDPARDGITLPLIRAAVCRGVPLLAICRGFQELNVALGGSLHQRLQDLPDRFDHSTPMQPSARLRQGKAHAVRITPGGWLHKLAGATEIAVNSLHNQGINRLAPGLAVEAVAPDGTIEAVRVVASSEGPCLGHAVGVQWHPEYDWRTDAVSRAIFDQFGHVVRGYAEVQRLGGVSIAAD
ncbi:gamma-glutamyl-gamma-aminobutyrate hydrolase family protein [Rhodopila sp.]|jgi:putative glutamine amidotransferase|uniref:gamma-glutamyl-gamma-aminobutyrate hydrolase family protein n=1 Tax=Rhodopila sp. TaxID=2480087 RepID=UPI002BC582D2|nr:gamma-glutamyl-gamma-aminobutyrate hydrolase family protein [Rhodopila sp.]HVZ06950.1 gamma-glutamyl-gamma-aminobutyrate hydrolase family protein [Rhodopila sp.]